MSARLLIEPEGRCTRRVGERIEIVSSTQAPYMMRDDIALILGLPQTSVRVVPTAVGGGFGAKLDLSVQPLLALAAWHLERPVAMVYSRPRSITATTKRHPRACHPPRRHRTAGCSRSTSTPISIQVPLPPGARPWPIGCRCMPGGPYVLPHYRCADAVPSIPTSFPPRRLSWLRRAADDDRRRSRSDRRTCARGGHRSGWSFASPERPAAPADSLQRPAQVLDHGAGVGRNACEALRPAWRDGSAASRSLQRSAR